MPSGGRTRSWGLRRRRDLRGRVGSGARRRAAQGLALAPRGLVSAAGAEREGDHGGRGEACRTREPGGEGPRPARAAPREWRGVELGREPRVEARRHGSGQWPLAELGERALNRRQLVLRHVALEAHVVHVR